MDFDRPGYQMRTSMNFNNKTLEKKKLKKGHDKGMENENKTGIGIC